MKAWYEIYDWVSTGQRDLSVTDFFKTPYKIFNPMKAPMPVKGLITSDFQPSSPRERMLYTHSFNSAHFRGLIG